MGKKIKKIYSFQRGDRRKKGKISRSVILRCGKVAGLFVRVSSGQSCL